MAGAPALLPPSKQSEAEQLVAQSKPIMGIFDGEDDSHDDDFFSATEDQRAAVQSVLIKRDGDHMESLG